MGQAKLRGPREQRVAAAIERREVEARAEAAAREERLRAHQARRLAAREAAREAQQRSQLQPIILDGGGAAAARALLLALIATSPSLARPRGTILLTAL